MFLFMFVKVLVQIVFFRCSEVFLHFFPLPQVPFSRADFHAITQDFIQFITHEWHSASWLQKFTNIIDIWRRSVDLGMHQCESMLNNEQLMATLRAAAFDAVLLDPLVICGDLVADMLDLPLVVSLRFSFGGVMERHCGHAPYPPSYVPVAPLSYGDHMTFSERLVNTLTYVLTSAMTEMFWRLRVDGFYSKVKGRRA